MPRSKKIFLFFIALFILLLAYLVYDIASRTVFPHQKRKQPSHTTTVENAD